MQNSGKGRHSFSIILFDLGNVLVKVDYAAFLRTLRFDHKVSERELYALLEEDSRAYEMGKVDPWEYLRIVNEKLGTAYTFDQFRKAWNAILPAPIPGMTELVGSLAPMYRLMVLSNTNALHCSHMLERLPVLNLFERLYLSYEIGALKPDPVVYKYVLFQVDVPARELLFIDDLEPNIRAAREAGMAGVIFQGVESLKDELTRLQVI